MFRLTTRALAAAFLCMAAAAAPAGAAISVPSFSLAPSTTQAGGSPNLALDVKLSSSGGDDVRDVTVSLAPGLLADPTAAPACSDVELSWGKCPDASQVGEGSVTAIAYGWPADYPAKLFLVEPQSNEPGRLGLVVRTPFGNVVSRAPVTLRTAPDVGLDVSFTDLPRKVAGTRIRITRIELGIDGAVGGRPFTRNPTACAVATTRLRAVSYDAPSSPASAETAFTPTGCAALPYAPGLTASAVIGTADDGVALTTAVTQAAGEAATRRIVLTLPFGLVPRASTLDRACPAADPATCPASATVGSATASIPLLTGPLTGRVVLVSRAVGFPGLTVLFPSPFPIRLDGVTGVAGGMLTTTFDPIPDIPLRGFDVHFSGGPDSLFSAGPELCSGSPTVVGDFTAHSGSTARVDAPLAVSGTCPPGGPGTAGADSGSAAGSVLGKRAAGGLRGRLSLRGLARRRPRLRLTLTPPRGAPALKELRLRLPRGLSVHPRRLGAGLGVKAGGRSVRHSGRWRAGGLRVQLRPARAGGLSVTLRWPALRVARRLARRVRRGRAGRLGVTVSASDDRGGTARLRLTAPAH